MATLIWRAPMHYFSARDEPAFFSWLKSIPGVLAVRCKGRQPHVELRSKRLPAASLRELIAFYLHYGGDLHELIQFENSSNSAWLRAPDASRRKEMFGPSMST